MTDAPPPTPARRGRPGYDQETVLRRAIDVFNRQGYDATSMGDLARELGLTKSAIYHHVPSKEHLLAAALDEALDGLSAAIDGAVTGEPGGSAYGRLRTAVEQSVGVLVRHLPAVTLSGIDAQRILMGQRVFAEGAAAPRVRLYAPSGAFLGLGATDGAGGLEPRRLLRGAHG